MHFGTDGKGQRYVEWSQASGGGTHKRAWVQYKIGDSDWAGTGRYLNAVRVEAPRSGPKGQATDFPIYLSKEQMRDDQILTAFVHAVYAVTGVQNP